MTRTEALRKLYKKVTNEEAPVGANTTTEALQKVYEALTNDTTHHINVTEIIDDLATNWDSGGGGGGSSDFSTAQVTVVRNALGTVALPVKYVDGATEGIIATHPSDNDTVVLYKGLAIGSVMDDGLNVSVSGNADYDSLTGQIFITGDCTITIS